MTCSITFHVEDDVAEEIIDSIDETVSSSSETWEFDGEFSIEAALRIRNQLEAQLDHERRS